MDEPLVCCILPYHTPYYVEQAFQCFHSQTYRNRFPVAVDTSGMKHSIGHIRNCLIAQTPKNCLIAHWDHDDWSAPDRLAQQVAVIQAGASVTGYHDLPFYDVGQDRVVFYQSNMTGYAVGTSLMYRREVWERTPFPDQSVGEDAAWQHAVRREQGHAVVSTSSLRPVTKSHIERQMADGSWQTQYRTEDHPLMVARQHAGCASQKSEQPRSTIMWGQNYTAASPELERAVRYCIAPSIVAQ